MNVNANQNCTVVTGLIDIDREQWSGYGRKWNEYLQYFKNTLSLNSKMVIFVQPKTVNFVVTERKKIDPQLINTNIQVVEFEKLPKYKHIDRIKSIMNSSNFKTGLVEPGAPEYCRPEYSIVILSKLDLVELAIQKNVFNTEYFMWVDAGICHNNFKTEYINTIFPKNENLSKIEDKILLLARSEPCEQDLNIQKFYKSHVNRICAGIIAGKQDSFIKFQQLFNENLNYCLEQNLIDSEQSIYTVCYLKDKSLFKLKITTDWYALFYEFV